MPVQVTADFKVFRSLGHLQWQGQEFSFGEGAYNLVVLGDRNPQWGPEAVPRYGA